MSTVFESLDGSKGSPLVSMQRDWVISTSVRWHLFAMAAFAIGMFAGFTFFLIGPVWAARVLGLFAMACGAAGILLMILALRNRDPVRWISLVTAVSPPATEQN